MLKNRVKKNVLTQFKKMWDYPWCLDVSKNEDLNIERLEGYKFLFPEETNKLCLEESSSVEEGKKQMCEISF